MDGLTADAYGTLSLFLLMTAAASRRLLLPPALSIHSFVPSFLPARLPFVYFVGSLAPGPNFGFIK